MLASAAAAGLAKFLSFYIKVFYVMGKALSGELSCPCDRSCYYKDKQLLGHYFSGKGSTVKGKNLLPKERFFLGVDQYKEGKKK